MFHQSPTLKTISNLKHSLLDTLLPLSCLLCGFNSKHPLSLCNECQTVIYKQKHQLDSLNTKQHDLPWQRAIFLSPYLSPVKELIQKGKFQQNLAAFKTLGLMLARVIEDQAYDPDRVLIPVPTHQGRLNERGYNQAYQIAKVVAQFLKLTINQQCVIRTDEAHTQHLLSKKQRMKNTQNVFTINGHVPKKIAVIDDVYTTGETMKSICNCLQMAGAENIEVWIIARTLKHSSGILTNK